VTGAGNEACINPEQVTAHTAANSSGRSGGPKAPSASGPAGPCTVTRGKPSMSGDRTTSRRQLALRSVYVDAFGEETPTDACRWPEPSMGCSNTVWVLGRAGERHAHQRLRSGFHPGDQHGFDFATITDLRRGGSLRKPVHASVRRPTCTCADTMHHHRRAVPAAGTCWLPLDHG
jgi:hypothetical protein